MLLSRRIILFCCVAITLFACNPKTSAKRDENKAIRRIIVLSPEVAEIVSALGAEDRIVGITEECDYPVTLQKCAKVGKFGSVNKESIIGLKPDVIFTSALEQDALTQELRKLGLRVEQFYPQTLMDLPLAVEQVGAIIGEQKKASDLSQKMLADIEQFKAALVEGKRPKVYLEIYRDPLMSVSDASFVGELIEAAGGDNIFSILERDYARVEAEDVVKANPDIIICYSQDSLDNILKRKGWQSISAIRNQRVYFEKDINPDWILRASPRSMLGIGRLSELFRQNG